MASKTIDKDKALRCHKCNEIGHWASECQNNADHNALYDTNFTFGSEPDQTAEDEQAFESLFNLNGDEDILSKEASDAIYDDIINDRCVMKTEEQGQFMPLN